jgi:hypothetical protein
LPIIPDGGHRWNLQQPSLCIQIIDEAAPLTGRRTRGRRAGSPPGPRDDLTGMSTDQAAIM